ncbi:DUF2164 domain-containing protein [Denitromonas iodatirespirans]|uniref:DUF2164 domain-containing protein n=1 Tax=Denitromonas iodatirespirans TaxID=2795389 RepID=A0A944H6Y7_DENI1|nr:DUF2164 domain-containing protein [Denitromonas iodatirespirans]MBT0959770.1 DUF2164 domain-containing protein [Denitromonas iodatirespirans]
MSKIEFSSEEKALLTDKLKRYLADELDQEVGQFEAGFLLDFISSEIGAYYYNRGLNDAQAVIAQRLDDINDAIYEIEMPTELSR